MKRSQFLTVFVAIGLLLSLNTVPGHRVALAAADQSVYGDSLASGWQDWSWDPITRNLATQSPVHSGTAAVSVTYTGGWSAFQLGRNTALDLTGYDVLRFWIHGGSSGGQQINVRVANGSSKVERTITAPVGSWTQMELSLAGLTPLESTVIWWQNATAGSQPTFYLDDITFVDKDVAAPGSSSTPSAGGPALNVDAAADQHAISPYIYGMNFADEALARELRLGVNRWGGNAVTRYNWQNDTSNRASDWFFENIPNDNANPAALPSGSSSDRFVEENRRAGVEPLLTIPLIGWTPKSRARACGFSVAKYGAQQSTDQWMPDCGNGVRPDGSNITGNDPSDTSVAATPAFVQGWIRHLQSRYGTAAGGGVRFYNLDNEPALWNSTHRDVHPEPLSYDELRDRTYQYAGALKAVDPGAQTLGPAEWGWTNYFYSAKDTAAGGSWWTNPVDRNAHGGMELVAWYLQEMRRYEQENGQRILDYLDLHYYPQASGVTLSPVGDATTQARRLRSTRALWDPTYTDESWINEPVKLIPRMRAWVNTYYPGTKLAITEYNWGGLEHINGALAQADVLGIFGREGLDLATLWSPPKAAEPGAFAFRMYRNYDGLGGAFGGTSVRANSADQDKLAVYAARRGQDGALTLMVINKTAGAITSPINLSNFNPAASAQVYSYSAADLSRIVRGVDQAVTPNGFNATFQATSITLFVIPGSNAQVAPTPTRTTSPPTATSVPPTATSVPPTATKAPPTATSVPPTATRTPAPTPTATKAPALAAPLTIYTDSLAADWGDWSWNPITRNLANTSPVYSGKRSIAVTYTGGWSGFQLGRSAALNIASYDVLRFRIRGSTGPGPIEVRVGNSQAFVRQTLTPPANSWALVEVPLAGLAPSEVTHVWWQNATSSAQPTFYLDNIEFVDK